MIRVTHISSARSWRGAEQQIALLLQAEDPGVKGSLFCPEGSELAQWACSGNVVTGVYRKRFGLDIAGAIRLRRFLREQNSTIVHLHDSHALNLYWLCTLTGLNIPAVLTRHVNFKPSNTFKYRLRGIRNIICVSEAVRDTMRSVAGTEKLRVIYPGIAPAAGNDRETLKRALGLQPQDRLIGMVGALESEKDPLAFVRIAEQVASVIPGVYFVLLGEGRMRADIDKLIREKALGDRIKLGGYRRDLGEVIGGLDLMLHTAVSEGFPLAILEGMQAGVPVICRDVAGLSEMVRNGENGFRYVDEREAAELVRHLLDNHLLYEWIRKQGRAGADGYTAGLMTEKTHTLYREILS